MNPAGETQNQDRTVFLSFTSLDRKAARAVVAGLQTAGVDVWWDEGGIGWGDDWQSKLEEALSRCGAYLILLGRGGVRRWVKPELGVALKRHVDGGLPILPLLLEGVSPESLPPFLSLFQARRLPPDLDGFDFAELAAELRGATAPTPPLVADACPFPGLLPFDEHAADFFLGRQADTLALLQRLGPGLDGVQRRWLQIEGPSGVGKSSLVRAGLIPAVRGGWLEETNPGDWTVLLLRPGERPLQALAAILEQTLKGKADVQRFDNLRSTARTDADDLGYLLEVALPEPNRLLLVIDQFEELFTLTIDPMALARIDALLATALEEADGPLYLVTTIRSDFLPRFGELPRLQGLLNARAGRYDLQPLSLAGLREIVRIPAQRAGLAWSEPSLPERIVEDAIRERAPLPLVANLLRLLWEAAQKRDDRILRAEDYRALNGVAGALAKGADRLLASLGADGRDRARGLLLALVKPGKESQDTKRPVSRAMALQAAGGGPEAERVLDRLSGLRDAHGQAGPDPDPRLVVVSETETDRTGKTTYRVDLAHEALLRLDPAGRPYWKTLRDWVDAWRKRLEDRDLLEVLAEQWQGAGRPRLSGVASRQQLRDFGRVGVPSPLAAAYLRASRTHQRLLGLAWAVGLAAVAVIVGSYYLHAARDLDFDSQLTWLALQAGHVYEPQMVALDGGPFDMGCVSGKDCDDDEFPVREVTVSAFAIGCYEVTFDEYAQFAFSRGKGLPFDGGFGRGRHPVINVSWEDAVEYAAWLSKRTRKHYRLPTEAEWEYATRAGTTTPFSTGECINTDQANHDGNYGWEDCPKTGVYREQTLEAGSLPANPWGLNEVHGNVWEWVQDCWHDTYEGAPTNGSAWGEEEGGDCGWRVLRGGSWDDEPEYLRSALRDWYDADSGFLLIGFRLAQDL